MPSSIAITRRRFAQVSLALAGSAAAPRLLVAAAPKGEGLFDVHLHLAQAWHGSEHGPITARQLLNWMDAHEVAQAAVLPLVSPEAFWYPITTEFMLQETREHGAAFGSRQLRLDAKPARIADMKPPRRIIQPRLHPRERGKPRQHRKLLLRDMLGRRRIEP